MAKSTLPAFNSGILSPDLDASTEVEKHRYGLKECTNMIITPLGGVKNSPGTEYIADSYNTAQLSRFIPFQFNTEQSYVLEFGNLKMRIIKDRAMVGGGSPTEIVSPYAIADVATLDHTSSADVLYMFHPDYNIRKITRTSHTAWTITEMPDMDGPYKGRVSGDEDVTINITFFSGSTWTFTADTAIFGDVEVGEPIRLGFPIPGDATAIYWTWYVVSALINSFSIRADLQEDTRPVYQQVSNPFFKNGVDSWQDTSDSGSDLSYNFVALSARLTDGAGGNAKMEQSVLTFANVNHRIAINISALIGTTPSVTLKVGTASGLGDIYTSAVLTLTGPYIFTILPTQEVIYINFDTIGSTDTDVVGIDQVELFPVGDEPAGGTEFNTTDWRLAAWNSTHGYPANGIIKDGRLICSNIASEPQTVWASKLGDFENFGFNTPGVATDAFSFTPSTRQINGIDSLVEQNGVKALTSGEILNIYASTGGAITPTDVNVKVDGVIGSLPLNPIIVGDSMVITPRGIAAVSELTQSNEARGYLKRDLSLFASHLFKDRRIIRWAYAGDPDSVIWCVLDDGTLLGLTYVKEYDMWAWHKHITPLGVGFADIAVIPNSSDDNIDDVYFIINRAEDGATPNYYIETLNRRITSQTAAFGLSASGTPYDYKFLDSALTYDVATTITGATKANPVVVTDTAHGYSNGDEVRIQNVKGMTELNNNVYTVTNKAANTYELYDSEGSPINGTAFTTYLAGGESRKMVTAVSGLDHLEGKTVTALADGVVETGLVVASGAVTLTNSASFIHIGIPYVSEIETLDIETMFRDTGSTQGMLKSVTSVTAYFKDTRGADVADSDVNTYFEIPFNDEAYGEDPPPLYNGSKEVIIISVPTKEKRIKIRQTKPLPIHIKRLIFDVDYTG